MKNSIDSKVMRLNLTSTAFAKYKKNRIYKYQNIEMGLRHMHSKSENGIIRVTELENIA